MKSTLKMLAAAFPFGATVEFSEYILKAGGHTTTTYEKIGSRPRVGWVVGAKMIAEYCIRRDVDGETSTKIVPKTATFVLKVITAFRSREYLVAPQDVVYAPNKPLPLTDQLNTSERDKKIYAENIEDYPRATNGRFVSSCNR